MKQGRQRIDQLLVARNLAESREKAQAMLLAGEVLVNGQKVTKAGTPVDLAPFRLDRPALTDPGHPISWLV